MQKKINDNFSLKNSGCSNSKDSETIPRHRWYLLKEAFSPTMVESAAKYVNCNRKDKILDPFCGSGTVPLTSSSKGFSALGIEVNPFLSFVSNLNP